MSFFRRVVSVAKTALIQLTIFAALCGFLEMVARYFEPWFKRPDVELGLILQPYMMIAARSGGAFVWQDVIANRPIPSTIEFNNYGFAERFDYTMVPDAAYLQQYGKKPGERIVLISGGSVVHGVGATANDKTIAAQLMRHLNERSGGPHYRVINIGMGSWIAYQQFIGLSLFGLPFHPDWIIVMDGHNDGATPCAQGSGVGNPLGWPKLLYLTSGGTGQQISPVLKTLARLSALIRIISGIKPDTRGEAPPGLYFDESDPDSRFLIKMAGLKVAEEDRQVEFYLQAQRNVLALFQHANVVLSSQPYMYDNAITPTYRRAVSPTATDTERSTLEADLDRYMAVNQENACSSKLGPYLLGYFMGRSALRLKDLAAAAQAADGSRRIIYLNTEAALPVDPKLRQNYFIDNAHLSDLGQDRIGELFADLILDTERGVNFDYAAFADESNEQPATKK